MCKTDATLGAQLRVFSERYLPKRVADWVGTSLARYVASKGSVAIDGVSLTVNEVAGSAFGVNVIAHTQQETTFGGLNPGAAVNLEVDMLARYVARLLGRDTL